MKAIKMTFKLQMSDDDSVRTRNITIPVRLSKNDYEYRITFKDKRIPRTKIKSRGINHWSFYSGRLQFKMYYN